MVLSEKLSQAKGSGLVQHLPVLYQTESHVDVTFTCSDGVKVKGHKALLGSFSPFLQQLFRLQPPREMVEIILPDVLSDDLDNVLRYIYEGCIRLDQEEVKNFKEIMKILQINSATSICNIPENEDDPGSEDEELVEVYSFSQCHESESKDVATQYPELKLSIKRLNPFNDNYENIKKMKVESGKSDPKEPCVPDTLNSVIRNFASHLPPAVSESDNQNTVPKIAVNATSSVHGPPRAIPLEYYREFVHSVLRKKTMEEAEIIIREEVERRLADELEKKLAERLSKEGKLIQAQDLRQKRSPFTQSNGPQVSLAREKGNDTPTNAQNCMEKLQTEKESKENGGKEKHSRLSLHPSSEKEGRGKELGRSSLHPQSEKKEGNGKQESGRPVVQSQVNPPPAKSSEKTSKCVIMKKQVPGAPQSSDQPSNASTVPMPKGVGIKLISPVGSSNAQGNRYAVTTDGKLLLLKNVKPQQYSTSSVVPKKVPFTILSELSKSETEFKIITTNGGLRVAAPIRPTTTTEEKKTVIPKEEDSK